MPKTITICSSVSFYEDVIRIKHELEQLGFEVLVPDLATQMEQQHDFNYDHYAGKHNDADPQIKQKLIDDHFRKIEKSDIVLIVNNTKHNLDGYVGANVLMEITVSYYLKKKLYLLNPLPKELPAYDEIMALEPVILNGHFVNLM